MLADIDFEQGIQDAWTHVATFVPKFLGFLVILLIGYIVAKALAALADTIHLIQHLIVLLHIRLECLLVKTNVATPPSAFANSASGR